MFPHSKNILLDKSVVIGLSYEDFKYLPHNLAPFITPPLVYELVGELGKKDDINNLKKKLQILSSKCIERRPQTISDYKNFLLANLLGEFIPIDGKRIPEDRGNLVRHKDGTTAYIIEELEEIKTLRRWSEGQFSESDFQQGQNIKKFKDIIKSIPEAVKQLSVNLDFSFPKIKNISELEKCVDASIKIYEKQDTKKIIKGMYNGYFDHTILSKNFLEEIIKKWEASGALPLSQYARYVFYCFRALMVYCIGIKYNLIRTSKKQNTYFDLQYIYYLPFCHFFSSGDKFHKDISSIFFRSDQQFLNIEELKKGSNFIRNQQERSKPVLTRFLKKDSIKQIWSKLHSKNKKEESKKIKHLLTRFNEGIRIDTGKSLKSGKLTQKYDRLTLKEKQLELLSKIHSILELKKNDWKYIKKNLNSNHIKEFYEFYGDIWRPDSNIFKYYETKKHSSFALMNCYGTHKRRLDFIYSLSIYFEGFYIFDFFQNPWCVKEEFNPIANPDQYVAHSLKDFFKILTLEPFIVLEQIIIIPELSDFIPGLQKEIMSFGDQIKHNFNIAAEDEQLIKQGCREQLLSLASRQNNIKTFLENEFSNIQKVKIDQEMIELCKNLRKNDPFILDQDFNTQELHITRGGTAETTYILSKLKGIPIITNNKTIHNIFLKHRNTKHSIWSNFTNKINNYEFKIIPKYNSIIRAEPLFDIKIKNMFKEFHLFLREVFHCAIYTNTDKYRVDRLTTELNLQLNTLDEQWKKVEDSLKQNKKDPQEYICSGKLHFTIEPDGFKMPKADEWIKKYMRQLDVQKSTVLIYGNI